LFSKGEEELFTHSVKDLLDIAAAYDKDFEEVKSAKDLDRYYIPTRYPNGLAGNVPAEFFDKPEECESAQRLTNRVIELVKNKILG
jgi:HEPN domain-containing protein